MKERASSTQSNRSSTSSTTASTPSSATPTASTQSIISTQNSETNNITDPFNKNNFMAPPIGGIIKCVTCLGNEIQGKVIAYDHQTKMMALSEFFV